ncbi:MrpH family fimbial adhesin [Serratia marcescens]|uniref:MrpH family fimbial adhesin n=1 Tax=Serratia marcescens TaxID=615 RepID=UPI003982EFAF
MMNSMINRFFHCFCFSAFFLLLPWGGGARADFLSVDYQWITKWDLSYSINDIDYSRMQSPSNCKSRYSCYACVHWANTERINDNWPVHCTRIMPPAPYDWASLANYVKRYHLPLKGNFSIPPFTTISGGRWPFCVVFHSSAMTKAVGGLADLCSQFGITVPEVPNPGTPPPPPLSCSLNGNEIRLDYGKLAYSELNLREVSSTAYLSCSGNATVSLSLPAGGAFNLSGNGALTSTVFINGQKGGVVVKNPGTITPVIFTSRLNVVGNSELSGGFSQSLVLTMSVI